MTNGVIATSKDLIAAISAASDEGRFPGNPADKLTSGSTFAAKSGKPKGGGGAPAAKPVVVPPVAPADAPSPEDIQEWNKQTESLKSYLQNCAEKSADYLDTFSITGSDGNKYDVNRVGTNTDGKLHFVPLERALMSKLMPVVT